MSSVELLEFALNNNFFQFASKFYQQIKGTSMGAAWAPAYACLHLGRWEEEEVFNCPMYLSHVHTWLRYIDDVLVIWTGDLDALHKFVDQLNTNERNIRLTYTYDRSKLSFLDLLIGLKGGVISTSTFRKENSGKHFIASRQPSTSLAKERYPYRTIYENQAQLFRH